MEKGKTFVVKVACKGNSHYRKGMEQHLGDNNSHPETLQTHCKECFRRIPGCEQAHAAKCALDYTSPQPTAGYSHQN